MYRCLSAVQPLSFISWLMILEIFCVWCPTSWQCVHLPKCQWGVSLPRCNESATHFAVVLGTLPHNAKRNQLRMRQWGKVVMKVPTGRVLRRSKGKPEQSKMVHCESTLTFTCLSILTLKKVDFSTTPVLPKCDFIHNASHYLNTCLKTAMFLLTPLQPAGCGFASDHLFGLFGVRNVGCLWEDDCAENTEFFSF